MAHHITAVHPIIAPSQPLYGFLGNPDPAKFVRAAGFSDVYFVRDSTVPLEQVRLGVDLGVGVLRVWKRRPCGSGAKGVFPACTVPEMVGVGETFGCEANNCVGHPTRESPCLLITAPETFSHKHPQITCAALPRAPAATTVTPHWLFIDGQQPATEENAPVDRPAAKRQRTEAELGEAGRAGAAGAGPKDAAGQGRKGGVLTGCRVCVLRVSAWKWHAELVALRFCTTLELRRQGLGCKRAKGRRYRTRSGSRSAAGGSALGRGTCQRDTPSAPCAMDTADASCGRLGRCTTPRSVPHVPYPTTVADGPASATGAAQAAAGGALGAAAAAPGAAAGAGAAAASPAAAAPVQHILSDEMQRLFEEVRREGQWGWGRLHGTAQHVATRVGVC